MMKKITQIIKLQCVLLSLGAFHPCFAKEDVCIQPEGQYTSNYFGRNRKESWEPYKKEFEGKSYKTCLEIGSWEGRSAIYFAENFFTGTNSQVTCIDTWEGGREHQNKKDLPSLYDRFLSNTQCLRESNKILYYRGKSKDVLLDLNYKLKGGAIKKFNLIYIDGSHDAKDVLVDAVLAWELLEIGGIMIFDDFKWKNGDHLTPMPAIKGFLRSYKSMYELLHKDYQVHIRKISDTPKAL